MMRLLMVEDEFHLAQPLQRGLREHGYEVDVAERGEDALLMSVAADYDVMLLNGVLPGMDGNATCARLRASGVKSPILIYSSRCSLSDRIESLDSGADDYLSRPFEFDELLARLRALVRRGAATRAPSTTQLAVGDLTLDTSAHKVFRGRNRIRLAPKEFGLLELLMHQPGTVVLRSEILENVWEDSAGQNSNVIDVHIRRLRSKLDHPMSDSRIETVRGYGYRLRAGD